MGMSAVALLGKDDHVDQVGNPAPEPEAEAPNPIADLVAQNQVALIGRARHPGRILFLLEDFREPCREVLVLLHVANCQLAHLPPPSPMGNSHPCISNTNAKRTVPV